MNGEDIQRYEYAKSKANDLGLYLEIRGKWICIYRKKDKRFYGQVETINQLYYWLCGYEWGKNE